MATTNEILESVRSRLAELPLSAEFWPEEEKDYRLNHPVGAALVGYAGAAYGPSRDTLAVVQSREISLAVILVFRQLNGPDGAVDMVDRIRALLTGFCPPDCGKLHMKSERFAGQASRLWWYELTLTCAGVLVEAMETEDEPKLTTIKYEGELECDTNSWDI